MRLRSDACWCPRIFVRVAATPPPPGRVVPLAGVCNERQVYWLVDRFHRRDRADETTVSSFSFVCDYYTSSCYTRVLSRVFRRRSFYCDGPRRRALPMNGWTGCTSRKHKQIRHHVVLYGLISHRAPVLILVLVFVLVLVIRDLDHLVALFSAGERSREFTSEAGDEKRK